MTSMIQFLAGGMKQCASARMGLLLAAAATVGMLSPGGASGQTVYQGTLYSSAGIYDTDSRGGLIVDSQGNLFGTTFGDGVTNGGTVFEIVPDPTDEIGRAHV